MHVLVMLAQRHWTGAAEPVLTIAKGLARRGHRVTFVYTRVPPGHLAGHVEHTELATLPEVSLVRRGIHPLSVWRDAARLRRFVRENAVDVIYCHQSHDHWLGWWARRNLARPPALVRHLHESRKLRAKADSRFLFARTDSLIVPARRWKQTILDRFGLDASRVMVLPPAVDTDRFTPGGDVAAVRAEIGAAADDRLVGMVARIKPGRGHEVAVAAFGELLKTEPRARLLLVGRGEGAEFLQQSVHQKPFAPRVHFLGYRTDDLPAIYAALDASLVLAEGSDGTCRAALEAMACGTAVVAAPVGTLPETIRDGRTGRLAAPDPATVAAALAEALAHPEWGEAARELVEAEHEVETQVDRAEAFFAPLAELR